jgi:phage-related minor tail protein
MNRKRIATGLISIIALLIFSVVAPAQTASSSAKSALAVPVSGSFAPSTTAGTLTSLGTGSLTGTFNIQQFVNQNGNLAAVGTFVGTLTNAAGQVTNLVINNVTATLTSATGSCQILSLTIGAVHLDLLGLVIDLNQINLNITAQSGPGNLLGNLLCDVANLLNGGGPLGNLSTLLNQLLGALRL